jgi:hypothetical protein
LVDALGNPVEFILTPGQDYDLAGGEPLLEHADPGALIADKAYDADGFIETLTERQITPVIPSHPRRATCPAILPSIASVISSSASSTNSSTFAPSRPATTNSPEISSPGSTWLPLSFCSTEDRP